MKYVAFFRNVNLGRPNCPSKVQFEAAFVSAGAESAVSFLTNGTIAFVVAAGIEPRNVLAAAHQRLQVACGLREPAFIRTIDYLAELVALDPFVSVERSSVHECCVSFLPQGIALPALPLESRRGDVEVFRSTGTEALSLSRKVGNTPGSPNAFLEKLFGQPVTTRAWNTVVRLVERHA
ncbi:DUF1697 domain-containing protein [Rhodanobacter sp. C05]|uniref:DUF1697 domain-containing protein n=1 Tax=Rhodanobacter sp. C05 TaxID=1945855 RepID=UPI000987950B|nr:DUF1697 domain-containing protein [Rhodanobacter sp. C05]OOG39365.1 hypothetical protein B0E51_12550 [Rhodanobacter sp. C05]